ncbi:MAG: ATP-binding protein [Deltaproteobacteria bacterium]|nr:ATP-binding protein [Deltaproteobacteria bacterium]
MRSIAKPLLADLRRKMVFVGGPRQVGKTTLAKALLRDHFPSGRYFNWDYDEDRRDLLAKRWSDEDRLLVFDEVHKYPRWKQWVKGVYDVQGDRHAVLVTGSARLDLYRRGGDSLMGRYHYWRLHPFSLDEIPPRMKPAEALRRLLTVGGFPEPFLDGSERFARRWRRERFDRILREDIRDLEPLRHLSLLALFADLLRHRVGRQVVLANLAADLQVSPKTAKAWLEVLERMYVVFVVRPYTRNLPRAIQKPPKVYFFDTGDVIGDDGARFENLCAAALLKRLHLAEDHEGFRYELRYLRDKEGREVDFVVLKDGVLEELIEVKHGDDSVSRALGYYAERLRPRRATQIVGTLRHRFDRGRLRVTSPIEYFARPI